MIELLVSHSEADAFARCERQHWYAHNEKLAPVKVSAGLDRGIRNHTCMEAYFNVLMNGGTFQEAQEAAQMKLAKMFADPEANTESINLVMDMLPWFFEADAKRIAAGWKVLAVEKEFRLKFPVKTLPTGQDVQIVYPFKVDLIRQSPSGDNYVVDTKTVYNFYTMQEMALMPQVPKYVGACRALDLPIAGGIMSQMRWRKLKDPDVDSKTRWDDLKITSQKIKFAFDEHIRQMNAIALYKLNPDFWASEVRRTLSQMVCKNCSFNSLCVEAANGGDTVLNKQINYKHNDYGYEVEVAADGE